eukprot:scaffold70829_cov27-Phaeocystis_antarctica.AAC.1
MTPPRSCYGLRRARWPAMWKPASQRLGNFALRQAPPAPDDFWLAGRTHRLVFHIGGPAHRTTRCRERARSARCDATAALAALAARPPRRRDAGAGAAAGGNGRGRVPLRRQVRTATVQVQAPGRSRGASRAISRRRGDLACVPLRCQVCAAAVQAPARGLRPHPAPALGNGRAPRPPLSA